MKTSKDNVLHTEHEGIKEKQGYWSASMDDGKAAKYACVHYCKYPPQTNPRGVISLCEDCERYHCSRCDAEPPERFKDLSWLMKKVTKRVCIECAKKRAGWIPQWGE